MNSKTRHNITKRCFQICKCVFKRFLPRYPTLFTVQYCVRWKSAMARIVPKLRSTTLTRVDLYLERRRRRPPTSRLAIRRCRTSRKFFVSVLLTIPDVFFHQYRCFFCSFMRTMPVFESPPLIAGCGRRFEGAGRMWKGTRILEETHDEADPSGASERVSKRRHLPRFRFDDRPNWFFTSTGPVVSRRNMSFRRPYSPSHTTITSTRAPTPYCPNDYRHCIKHNPTILG